MLKLTENKLSSGPFVRILIQPSIGNCEDIFDILINIEHDPKRIPYEKITTSATKYGNEKFVKRILDMRIDGDMFPAIQEAAKNGYETILSMLIDVTSLTKEERYDATIEAIEYGHVGAARLLQ